jgi:peptidoglycan hydrolase-like protein with peptidoglycan-binding domain
MTWTIPNSSVGPLRAGDRGITVWALQTALGVHADGVYGPLTQSAVESFQRAKGLTLDGKAGTLETQPALIAMLIARSDAGTPDGLARGIAQGESTLTFGAVNWSVAGGVDVGAFQRRLQLAPTPTDALIEWGFNVATQAKLVSASLIKEHNNFLGLAGTKDAYKGMSAQEKAWRLAALDHNYPRVRCVWRRRRSAPCRRRGRRRRRGSRAPGTTSRTGTAVRTPLEWTHLYAGVLAGAHGTQGSVTKYVTNWIL